MITQLWVLTGDKQETAINIGYSSQLLTDDLADILIIEGSGAQEVRGAWRIFFEERRFFFFQGIKGFFFRGKKVFFFKEKRCFFFFQRKKVFFQSKFFYLEEQSFLFFRGKKFFQVRQKRVGFFSRNKNPTRFCKNKTFRIFYFFCK